ncbi:hypothetical protein CGCSCA1_v002839 [Colletotrichum siamense]|nr:hypothetical protein CGCSCA1_v002839 [Colletotrichum siamense]
MEKIFSSAYFTIAASCAKHRFDGFLKERSPRDFVTFAAKDGATFYACDIIDNFDHDVEHGPLNQRGWVLQERALSRLAKQLFLGILIFHIRWKLSSGAGELTITTSSMSDIQAWV